LLAQARAVRVIMGKTERSKWAGAHESTREASEFQLGKGNTPK
jgi:hypothetical protein